MSFYSALRDFVFSPTAARIAGEPLFFLTGRRKGMPLELNGIRRVLVIKLDELGDAVMATPFMRELRAGLPNASITLVVKPQLKELWELCPYIDELLTYDRLTGPANIHGHSSVIEFSKDNLWEKRFDLAIVPRWDADPYYASFMAYFSGATHRVGYSEKTIGHKQTLNRGFDRLFTKVFAETDLKHDSERNLDLLRGLGLKTASSSTELWIDRKDMASADELLASKGIMPSARFACLYPSGGSSVLKQWPAENFVRLGRWLSEAHGLKILVAGGPGDDKVCQDVAQGIGPAAVSVASGLGLRVAAAIFKRCSVFIGNDTGPTHMAAAMGAPVVAIFGASCPHRFAPMGNNCTVIWKALECTTCVQHGHADRCAKCVYQRPACLDAVTVEELKTAVRAILEKVSR